LILLTFFLKNSLDSCIQNAIQLIYESTTVEINRFRRSFVC